jgi:hypothetical protein
MTTIKNKRIMNIQKIVDRALQLTNMNGGATILKNGKEANKGYAVGGLKEYKIPYNSGDGILLGVAFSAILSINTIDCDAYGFWVDGDTLYIDAVTIFQEETDALAFATKNKELAIYCIHNQQEIRL